MSAKPTIIAHWLKKGGAFASGPVPGICSPGIWALRGAASAGCSGKGVKQPHSRPGGAVRSEYTPGGVSVQSRLHRIPADPGLPRDGPGRDLLMASMFGASALTDAFNVAFRIPNLFRRLFAEGAFAQALCPCWQPPKPKKARRPAHRLIAAVATALAWTLLLTCTLGVLGRQRWCGLWPAACAKPPRLLTLPC